MVTMREYALNFETDLYGPYCSEQQARFARSLFQTKHPDLAEHCDIEAINPDEVWVRLIDPRLLH